MHDEFETISTTQIGASFDGNLQLHLHKLYGSVQ